MTIIKTVNITVLVRSCVDLYFCITKGGSRLSIAVECTWSNYTCELYSSNQECSFTLLWQNTGWCTKCHTIDCALNTFLLLQKHLTPGTKLILTGWKIVPNEEHVQCDHRFASQPLANEPLHSSHLFDTSLQKVRGTNSLCGP